MSGDVSLIDRIYEAAVLPELWHSVLDEFAAHAGAKYSVLILGRGTFSSQLIASSAEYGALIEDHNRLFPSNIRTRRLLARQHPGFVRDIDVLTQAEIDTEPLYQQFYFPKGVGFGAATVIDAPSGDNIIVHAEFAYAHGPASPELVSRLDGLRPHLARAALLSARLGLERARARADTLQALGIPGAVLRGAGRLQVANSLFEALIPSIIEDRHNRVRLIDAAADRLLADALTRLTASFSAPIVSSIPIAAEEARPAMIVHLLPVRRAAHDMFSSASTLLMLTPVDRARVPGAEMLQGLFYLTPAEARVARCVGETLTVDQIAERLGISRKTVRSQLKSVLAKTGLSRQQQLISLLAGTVLPTQG